MISLPPFVYRAAAIFLGLALLASVSYLIGRNHGLQRYYEYKAAVESEMAHLQSEIAAREKQHEKVVADVSRRWADALDAARRERPVRVRQPDRGAGGLSVAAAPPGKLNANAGQLGFGSGSYAPTEIPVEQCEERLNRAVEDAAQVLWLQEWALRLREGEQ